MKNLIRQRSVEFFITVIVFGLCFVFFAIVTDDYTSFSSNCAEGQFSNYPYCKYYWGYLGISWVYLLLYQTIPAYDWLSISLIAFEFCSLYLILRCIKKVIFNKDSSVILIRTTQFLFALFFVENVIYLSHTRSSLLMCGVALINLIFSEKIDKKYILINVLLFIFGMLIRPESGMGMLLLVSTGYLIYRVDIPHLIKRSFLPCAAVAVMSFAYFMDWSHSDLFLKKVEPEVEYKLMEKRVINISSMHNALDSVKYQAAVAGTCFDTRVLTPEYFRTILLPGPDLSVKHASDRLFHVLSFYRYYLFVPLYSLALLLLCLFHRDRWEALLKIMLSGVATFVIIYMVDYTGGLICGRHFLNLQLISLLITTYYFSNCNTMTIGFWKENWWLSGFCALLLLYGILVCFINYKKSSDYIVDDTHCYENAMQEMENLYTNRIIVLTTDDFHLFDHAFSVKNRKYTKNTYLMYDVWTYCLSAEYTDYLAKKCNCDPIDPNAFFRWLSDNNALYIAEPWRYDLTSRYMNLVHDQKLKFLFNNEYTKPECIDGKDIGKFELRKVVVEH